LTSQISTQLASVLEALNPKAPVHCLGVELPKPVLMAMAMVIEYPTLSDHNVEAAVTAASEK
jgi:hypothetical protein